METCRPPDALANPRSDDMLADACNTADETKRFVDALLDTFINIGHEYTPPSFQQWQILARDSQTRQSWKALEIHAPPSRNL